MINKPPPQLTNFSTIFSQTPNLQKTKQIHSHLITTNLYSFPQFTTSLISHYSKLDLPLQSLSVFLSSPHAPNLFTFNAIISSLSSNNYPSHALHYYNLLRFENPFPPDKFTYPCTIKACTDLGLHCVVERIHCEVVKIALEADKFVASALIRSYLEFGSIQYAQKLFDELPEKDVVLWNAMVTGFAQMGDFRNALVCFRDMGSKGMMPSSFTVTGILSVFTAMGDVVSGRKVHGIVMKAGFESEVSVMNALIDLYGKCHEVEHAVVIFEGMKERDLFSWNSMVSAFQYNADHGETLRLFGRMQSAGVQPDAVTLLAVLPACAQAAALMHGRKIHTYMVTSGMSPRDIFVQNALVDMYAKSGALFDAKRIFDTMHTHDTASWNIIIHGYAAHGLGLEALDLFDAMCSALVTPDEVTFVGLLSACSHAGLVDQGRDIFDCMESSYSVAPVMEHYSCMVDLLGRAGRLGEAQVVAEKAKEAGVWRAYLAACKMHGKTEEALEVAERVVELEPKRSGVYVLLANSYGSDGRFEEVEEIRGEMWRRRVKKVVGCSWLEVGGSGIHMFMTGDWDHPKANEIHGALHCLAPHMW